MRPFVLRQNVAEGLVRLVVGLGFRTGGSILIQSTGGMGSTFVIELPREAVEGLRPGAAPYILV